LVHNNSPKLAYCEINLAKLRALAIATKGKDAREPIGEVRKGAGKIKL
jgi:hypothetical protein